MRRWVARRTGHGRTAAQGFSRGDRRWAISQEWEVCSSQEEKEPQPHENFRASFLRSRCVGPCLLPPGLCFFFFFFLQNNFHWKRETPCQCSVFNLFLLLYSIVRSWQLALGKHQIRHQTPVARASSCLPTLTNPAPTDAPSHHPANKKTKQNKSIKTSTSVKINNCGIKVGVFFFFSWMEVERRTATQTAQIPRGAERLFGRTQKRCSTLPLCRVRGKGRDQRTPVFPGARGWSLRMSDCTWWRGKWAAAGEAFWPSWPGQRALLWRMSSGWKEKRLPFCFFTDSTSLCA